MTKKILIVDDDKILSKILRDAFQTHAVDKYEVISAFDGEEGLTLALEQKPDLIMLDLVMPKLSGIDFLKKLRADERGKNIPVLVATQVSDMEKMSEGMELGVRGYIIKADYSVKEILSQIDEVLK